MITRLRHVRSTQQAEQNEQEASLVGITTDVVEHAFSTPADPFPLLKAALDQARERIYIIGADYRFLFTNERTTTFHGWRAEKIIGWHVSDLVGELVFQRLVKPRLDRCLRGEEVNCRHWITTRTGRRQYIDALLRPVHDRDGQVVAAIATISERTAQKRLEEKLKDQAALYRQLVENSVAGIAILQNDEIAFANQAAATIFGYRSVEEFRLETGPLGFVAPYDRARVRSYEQAYAETQLSATQHQFDGVRKDGAILHLLVSANSVLWQGRRACQLIIVNITKRKRAERALAATAVSFRDMIEGSLQGFFAIEDDRYVYANQAFADLLGYSVDEIKAAPIESFYAVHERRRTLDMRRRRYKRDPASEVYEIDALHKSGRILRLQKSVRLTDSWFGGPAILGFVVDVTERHQAEKALQNERNLLRAMIDNIPAVVFAKDRDSRFLVKNKKGAAFVGETEPNDLLGRSDDDYYPADLAAQYRANELRVMATGEPLIDDENEIICPGTGETVVTSGCIAPLIDADCETVGIVGVAQDITKFRASEKALRESEQRFKDLAEMSSDWFWEMDAHLRFTYFSDRTPELAKDHLEMLGKRRTDLMIELDDNWRAHIEDLVNRRPFRNFRYTKRGRDGRIHHTSASGLPMFDANGVFKGYRGAAANITAEVEAQRALAEERNLLRAIIDNIPDAIYAKDRRTRFILKNRFDAMLMGAESIEETIGKTDFDYYPQDIAEGFYRDDCEVIESGTPIIGKVEKIVRGADGEAVWYNSTKLPLRNTKGEIIGLVGIGRDITEAKPLADRLHYQATHDTLTDLLNRAAFERRLAEALDLAKSSGDAAVLCYIDFDQFKILNDSVGHVAGDQLIRQMADLFKERAEAIDATLARLGGDEFGLLIENCTLEHGKQIAQDLIDAARTLRFSWDDRSFGVGISIGITMIDRHLRDVNDALAQADVACYAAKDNGRNRLCIYRQSDKETRRRHEELLRAASLEQAVASDSLTLLAQPIVRLGETDLPVTHYEILLRLTGPDGELHMPGAFIPAAERYSLMSTIDQWVVRTSLELLKDIACPVEGRRFNINLSGHSLTDDAFQDALRNMLKDTAISTGSLCFEITETAVISNLACARRFISELREMGCHIALDDFGCGLSSFGYLKQFPVDYLKIDGSFIKHIADDKTDRAIVEAINRVGHVSAIKTVAECVEDKALIGVLRELGVDYAQGLAVGPPVPLRQIIEERSGKRCCAVAMVG